MNFPIYRKYTNDKVFFKIISETEFEEITLIGSKTLHQTITATTYAERLYIKDMIDIKDGRWLVCEQKEFEKIKDNS